MAEMFLEASVRKGTGKSVTRKLRQAGEVPGVVYGLHEPVSVQVNGREALRVVQAMHGYERLLELRMKDGGEPRQVLVKEVQSTPVTGHLLHIDFLEVNVNVAVQVDVVVQAVGEPEGVVQGGVLQTPNYEVSVSCLPTSIPEQIEVDISHLNVGDSLHVSDVTFPPGVEPVSDPELTLFTVSWPAAQELPEAEEAAEEEAAEAAEGEEAAEAGEEAGEGEEAAAEGGEENE